jgi:class 3 adenylate cyclase/pimeloyl-ACP methyl ester carboxylesterase
MSIGVTEYVKTAGGYVAYQQFGAGPPDILFITNWCTNLEVMWEEPSLVRFFERLAEFGRVICFDKRGTGISDPVPLTALPTLEEWMDDASEVLQAVGSRQAVLIGDTDGGLMAVLFAATFPDKVSALILVNAYARMLRDVDYPLGLPRSSMPRLLDLYERGWGTGEFLDVTAPSVASDMRFRKWFARYQRLSMSPGASTAMYHWVLETDVRPILPTISAPTLVLHRSQNDHYRIGYGKYLSEQIAGARFVELPGADCFPFHTGEQEPLLDEIQEYLTGERGGADSSRVLATIMLTDIVRSTQHAATLGDVRWKDLLEEHHALIHRLVVQYRGREFRSTGDGFLLTFDGPARGIRCAMRIVQEIKRLGMDVRIGLHTGEVEIRNAAVEGIAVHLAARVMGAAGAGEVLVSRTVKDLVAGSSFHFEDRGMFPLKGFSEKWHLFSVGPSALSTIGAVATRSH